MRVFHWGIRWFIVLQCIFVLVCPSFAQALTDHPPAPGIVDIPAKTLNGITRKFMSLQQKLLHHSQKALRRLQKQEAELGKRLANKDSVAAKNLFASGEGMYAALQKKLLDSNVKTSVSLQNYVPNIDSISTLLAWLEKPGATGAVSPERLTMLKSASDGVGALQKQLAGAAAIQDFIRRRKAQWQSAFENTGLAKQLTAFKKEAYYYQAQVNEYKQMLNDPDKMLNKALSVARNNPAFSSFMRRNGFLSQLFPSQQSGFGSAQAIQGLQTRTSVQQQLASRFGSGNVNPQQYIQQQVASAQAQLSALKDKINKAGGGNADLEMPDFKPNTQKTKSFWKRIEYGLNIQSQRPNGLLPVTSDIAFTAGYKLNDKSVIGIGAGYKMGWGKDIRTIRITSEGLSLRSYLDIRCKGSFWISGGYEYNYQQSFGSITELKNLNAWQKSGLIGVTKKYKVGKKNGNMQLLWDFLSYGQVPKTTPLKFRVGYVF